MPFLKKKKTISSGIKPVETKKEKTEKTGGVYQPAVNLLIKPLITEKTRNLAIKENKYVFNVKKESNKKEIKKAIENLYKVEVIDVNIINTKSKPKRLGRSLGKTKGFKKAIVTIRKGQTIDVIPT